MCSTVALTALYIVLVSATIMGAPVADKTSEVKKRSATQTAEAPDQEKDLQDLLNLVHKESNQNDVVVHKEQVSHFENNNGQKIQVQAKEEKVVDKNTGKLIADVKQEVKQASAGNDVKPETVVETKVDIPAEGVHETFVQEGQDNENEDENREEDVEAELTPADMAEYLYATQRFPAFYAALDRLVNSSKMSAQEAESYTKAVALEYERLQLEEFEESVLAEKRLYPEVPQEADVYGQDAAPYFNSHLRQEFGAEDKYGRGDYYGYPPAYISPEEQLSAQQALQGNIGDIDPVEFLAALSHEAYGEDNEEAQEIIKMLYDRVSQDDNPDDMGQIRDLLVETIAASMNEDPYNYQADEVQQDNTEPLAPAEVVDNVKEEEAKAVEQVQQQKPNQDKQATQTEHKEGNDKKVTEQTGNKADQQKQ